MWIESYSLKEREKVSDNFFSSHRFVNERLMFGKLSKFLYSQLFRRYKIIPAYNEYLLVHNIQSVTQESIEVSLHVQ